MVKESNLNVWVAIHRKPVYIDSNMLRCPVLYVGWQPICRSKNPLELIEVIRKLLKEDGAWLSTPDGASLGALAD